MKQDLNRSLVLTRVTAAVRAGNRHRETTRAEIPSNVGYLGAGPDPVNRLFDELRAVGAHPQRVSSLEAAQAAIRSLVEQFVVHRAIRSSGAVLEELEIDDLLRSCGVELLTPKELEVLDESARRDRVFAAELGVTAADWAIAETGSLVYAAGPNQTRSATLLPPVHLTVVDSSRVLADLFDLSVKLDESKTDGIIPRNVALVTGPSKTGDIELRLTTGVHGPGELHVLIWEDK